MRLKTLSIIFLLITLSGCSSSPESDPAYVSPTQYLGYNCNQIGAEMKRVSAKIEQANETQGDKTAEMVLNTALSAYAISRGYGVGSSDDSAYRRLINQYDVLEQTAIQKECSVKK